MKTPILSRRAVDAVVQVPQQGQDEARPSSSSAVGWSGPRPCAASWRKSSTTISSVSWSDIFGWSLLPGTIIGVLLGCAKHIRTTCDGLRLAWASGFYRVVWASSESG
jgi:hypothetical protein